MHGVVVLMHCIIKLISFLQVFKNVTLKLSEANVLPLHQVIPIIDYIRNELDKVINDESKLLIIRKAAQNAALVLDRYYAWTDESVMYRVAICKCGVPQMDIC